MAYNDHFFVQIRPKKVIFQSFYQYFLRTTGLQHKLLKLIESSNIFHWKSAKKKETRCGLWEEIWVKLDPMLWNNKETGISIEVFHVLHEVYI